MQHGAHCYLGGKNPDVYMGDDVYCTIETFENFPIFLHAKGYACGLSGKWNLEDSLRS